MEHFIRFTVPFNRNVTDNVTANVTDNVTDKAVVINLNHRQNQVLEIMKSDIRISTSELAERLSVAQRTIKRDIEYLKQKGLVTRVGNERTGYWVVLK